MLLFRSEEHIDRWCKSWRMPHGATLSIDQAWRLAQAWYGPDRRELAWRRKTADEAEVVFAELGLTGAFWNLH